MDHEEINENDIVPRTCVACQNLYITGELDCPACGEWGQLLDDNDIEG